MNLNKCTHIGDFTKYEKELKVSHSSLFLKSSISTSDKNIIINAKSLISKYYDIIIKNTISVTLSDTDYLRYRYNPKLYCYEKYGTTELWSLLLKVNNMTSVTEFTSKSFTAFSSKILDVINEVLILENDNIKDNEYELDL